MPFPPTDTFKPGFKRRFIAEKSKVVFPLTYIVNVHEEF